MTPTKNFTGCTKCTKISLKSPENAEICFIFWVKMCKKEYFFALFGVKYAFFEAFLGVKKGKNKVFSVNYAPETV
jgi:hypothetical protein